MLNRKNNINQPVIFAYLKNSISLMLFFLVKFISGNKRNELSDSILFINTGQIGDLVLSTSIFVNEDLFDPETNIYFLIKKQYSDFFTGYTGRIKLILWDQSKYRYSLIYRCRFIKYLQTRNLELTVNLTTARGPLNDELTLLSGAAKKYCLNNDYKYLKRVFGNYYDRFYTKIFATARLTEFEKQISLLACILKKKITAGTRFFLSTGQIEKAKAFLDQYMLHENQNMIIVNPFSDIEQKNWPSKNYRELFQLFLKEDILIICQGSSYQKNRIKKLIDGLKNVVNIAGELTLSESAALIFAANLYIGNDSGFTHIAKALMKNSIAIIGCGSNGSFYPYLDHQDNQYLLFNDVDCKGCNWICIRKKRICLEDVSTEQVYKLAMKILS